MTEKNKSKVPPKILPEEKDRINLVEQESSPVESKLPDDLAKKEQVAGSASENNQSPNKRVKSNNKKSSEDLTRANAGAFEHQPNAPLSDDKAANSSLAQKKFASKRKRRKWVRRKKPLVTVAERWKFYLDERIHRNASYISVCQSQDKLLSTLLMATIGAGITLRWSYHAIDGNGFWIWSMAILLFAIVLSLIAAFSSEKAFEKEISHMDEEYSAELRGALFTPTENNWNKWTRGLRYSSAISFVLGLILMVCFAYSNFSTVTQIAPNNTAPSTNPKPFTATPSSSTVIPVSPSVPDPQLPADRSQNSEVRVSPTSRKEIPTESNRPPKKDQEK